MSGSVSGKTAALLQRVGQGTRISRARGVSEQGPLVPRQNAFTAVQAVAAACG